MLLATSDYAIGAHIGEIAAPIVFGLPAGLLVRRAWRRPAGRARTTDWIAALVFGALFLASGVRLVHHSFGGPWQTQQGRDVHAGFVAGCERTTGGRVDCGCVFAHLTDQPAYDTPQEFLTLDYRVRAAAQRGDPSALPPELVAAVRDCVVSG